MTDLAEVLLLVLPGIATGGLALIAGIRESRRHARALEESREELLVTMRQMQTEYLDGIEEVARGIRFAEESTLMTEEALRERLTPSLRARAIQLIRSGISPDTAAPTLSLARSDVRLIATVNQVLSSSSTS